MRVENARHLFFFDKKANVGPKKQAATVQLTVGERQVFLENGK